MVIEGGLNLQKLSLFAIYAPSPLIPTPMVIRYKYSVYVLDIAREILAYNYMLSLVMDLRQVLLA